MAAHIKERRKKVVVGMKWCSWHRKHEPIELFGKSTRSTTGFQSECHEGRVARHKKEYVPNGERGTDHSGRGYTAELAAAADANERCRHTGGWAYLNPVPFTADDVFAKTTLGWKTIQVKTAGVFKTRNGLVLRRNSRGISSEILALVSPEYCLIRYIGLRGALPSEFPTAPTKFFEVSNVSTL